jgi:hypothetical protein
VEETLRLLERSVFLLVSGAVDESAHRKLWKAYQTIPTIDGATDDETLLRASEKIKEYLFQVINDLAGTRWSDGLSTTLREAEWNADAELRRAEVPTGFQPFIYREYFISLRRHAEIKGFLEQAIADSDALREQTFGMLRNQKRFHEGRG